MLCRCLSHAKLLNNLWGKFPLVQKHTLQLKKYTLQLTRYHASQSGREAGVLYMFIQFTLFLSDKSCCFTAVKGLQYLAVEIAHLVQRDVLGTSVELDYFLIRHWFEPPRRKTTGTVRQQSPACKELQTAEKGKTGTDKLISKIHTFLLHGRDSQRARQLRSSKDSHKTFPKTFSKYLVHSFNLIEGLYPHSSRVQTGFPSVCCQSAPPNRPPGLTLAALGNCSFGKVASMTFITIKCTGVGKKKASWKRDFLPIQFSWAKQVLH